MRMPSFSAFSSLLGPMFSPARMKLVFLEMLPTFLPPCFSISSLYSSREWRAKTPLMTMDWPCSLSVWSDRSFSPAASCQAGLLQAFDQGTVFLVGEIQPDALGYLLSDFVHMDQIIKCGLCEGINGSKGFGNFLATVSPTKRMPRAKSTLS